MPLEVACKSSKGLTLPKTCADRRQSPRRAGGRLFPHKSFKKATYSGFRARKDRDWGKSASPEGPGAVQKADPRIYNPRPLTAKVRILDTLRGSRPWICRLFVALSR